MKYFKFLVLAIITCISISLHAQWVTSANDIFYNTGKVGINTLTPEAQLDVNGTLQLKRVGDADVNNPLKNSSLLHFQSAFWESTAQTSKWSLYSKRNIGMYWGNPNKNKSKLVFTQDDGTERMSLDDNGNFDLYNRSGGSLFSYDHITDRLLAGPALWATQITAPYFNVVKMRGYNWEQTNINFERNLIYTASCDCTEPNTAHKFTTVTPYSVAGSNIATFDNGTVPLVIIDKTGNVFAKSKLAIGDLDITKIGSYSLAVNGDARFNKAVVKANVWPDYVFESDYNLPSLEEISTYIKLNKHLPDVPSASDVEKNGIDLGANQAILLKKIEELTLYVIDLKKEIDIIKTNKSGRRNR